MKQLRPQEDLLTPIKYLSHYVGKTKEEIVTSLPKDSYCFTGLHKENSVFSTEPSLEINLQQETLTLEFSNGICTISRLFCDKEEKIMEYFFLCNNLFESIYSGIWIVSKEKERILWLFLERLHMDFFKRRDISQLLKEGSWDFYFQCKFIPNKS